MLFDITLNRVLQLPSEQRPLLVLEKLKEFSADEEYQRAALLECGVSEYCVRLLRAIALKDVEKWNSVMQQLERHSWDGAGLDHRVLDNHRAALAQIGDFDTDDEVRTRILKSVESTLRAQLATSGARSLRLTALCAALSSCHIEEDKSLSTLLGLPAHLRVYRFEDQVDVCTDSIRRPCVIRASLSDGSTRRWLIKSGESPAPQVTGLAFCRAVRRAHPSRARHLTTYLVRELNEECTLIEFLEQHERLDAVATRGGSHPLPEMSGEESVADAEVRYRVACERLSALTLREAVAARCLTGKHFVQQQQHFTESLAATAVLTALIGLGDRHAQNIMLSRTRCSVVHVDWASSPRHGAVTAEPAPARLTRNMIALCSNGIENLVMEWSERIRAHAIPLAASARLIFRFLPPEHQYKLTMIEDLLHGRYSYHQVALQQLKHQQQDHRASSLVLLLEDMFTEFPEKESYTVEEQVSSLLRMSTDPRVLALTRGAWQPHF
ncbi:unnamed protein product [Leptosia nina]|uniref:PI3K/PI4K catalytic domain-containing protein n=1 Tax=Leptosia nina TaxID=320188 RepID=A0AAV1JQD0_9NEOP